MTYREAIIQAQNGYTLRLPNINANFNWNYTDNVLLCDIELNEDISGRIDWYLYEK